MDLFDTPPPPPPPRHHLAITEAYKSLTEQICRIFDFEMSKF